MGDYSRPKIRNEGKKGRYKVSNQARKLQYQGVSTVVMKNWEPFVLGPALAIDRRPTPLCLRVKFSSGKVRP